jgi:hypothetical protein
MGYNWTQIGRPERNTGALQDRRVRRNHLECENIAVERHRHLREAAGGTIPLALQ